LKKEACKGFDMCINLCANLNLTTVGQVYMASTR